MCIGSLDDWKEEACACENIRCIVISLVRIRLGDMAGFPSKSNKLFIPQATGSPLVLCQDHDYHN